VGALSLAFPARKRRLPRSASRWAIRGGPAPIAGTESRCSPGYSGLAALSGTATRVKANPEQRLI